MIPRYSLMEMDAIWSEQRRLDLWLEIELLACEAMEEAGKVPAGVAKRIRAKRIHLDPERVQEIEEVTKHDINAFLDATAELAGEDARWLHRGMTSSDLVDTSFAVQLKEAGRLVMSELDEALTAVATLAHKHKSTPCMGRSHGVHAEPTTFGLKFAGWYVELVRRRKALAQALETISVGQLSGAVGTYAFVSPQVEAKVCERLGLKPDQVPTQVISRDRHAEFFSALALLGATIERCAVEVRHGQRTEVREISEAFSKGQKGSSAMPHKKNPILSENLTGLARLLRSYAQAALENVALWHERDISHSSVERVIGPDATTIAHFMLRRFQLLVKGLVVDADRALENIQMTQGVFYSQAVLLALVDKGVSRQAAYRMVQRNALAAWEDGTSFQEKVLADSEILDSLGGADVVEQLFSLSLYTKEVDYIFERAFEETSSKSTAKVEVVPRKGVLDPQGKAIRNALEALGFEGVEDVLAGKVFHVSMARPSRSALDEMAKKLLANPVVEDYSILIEEK